MTDKFITTFNAVASRCFEQSCTSGFWDDERNNGEAIALMHSELSEALEGLRHGNPLSDHIPEFTAVEEEFADCIIRMMDLSHGRGWDIAKALIAKMEYNASRQHKHGKEF